MPNAAASSALACLCLATPLAHAGLLGYGLRAGAHAYEDRRSDNAPADAVYVPDPARTPGALNPDINQANFHERICVGGTTQSRPEKSYTSAMKTKQLREFGYANRDPWKYEEDHLIPLSLGGHPRSPKNLWPEPWKGEWGADKKDLLEFALYKAACKGEIALSQAQAAFSPDWTASYRRYQPLIRKYQYKHAGDDAAVDR